MSGPNPSGPPPTSPRQAILKSRAVKWLKSGGILLGHVIAWDGWTKVAGILTAAAAVAALWFSGKALRETQNQYSLSEQGQVTSRFNDAIQNIGSEKQEIRLGGIYALGRLAQDSKQDSETIAKILAAYVRTHAPLSEKCKKSYFDKEGPQGTTVPEDVQAAMDVLGQRGGDESSPIDLSNTCLTNVRIPRSNLAGANLSATNLAYADMTDSDLAGAILYESNLFGARLDGADLSNASLHGAYVARSSGVNANMSGVDLAKARLDVSDFSGANMSNIRVSRTDFTGTNFSGSNFSGANINGVNFTNVNLCRAQLREAMFVRESGTYSAAWTNVHYDDQTTWPDTFPRPATPNFNKCGTK